jgi:drug/metabolite transporter (DMT)-like permease
VVDAPLAPAALEEAGRPARRALIGYGLVLAAVTLWSLNAPVAKVAIESGGLTSLRLSEVRAAGSAVLLLAILALVRPRSLRLGARDALFLAAFGILGLAFVHFLYFTALERLDIGTALVIEYVAPVLVALWARFYAKERLRKRFWLALALSLVGLSLVVELWSGLTLDGLGVAAAFAGALSYAAYTLMADSSLRGGRDVYSLLAWGFLFAALFWSVAQPWWSFPRGLVGADVSLLGRLDGVSLPLWLLLGSIVILGTIVPFVCFIGALHYISPTRTIVFAMVEPVLAGFVAWAWLGETLGGDQIAGGVLVLAAVTIAQSARSHPVG